MESARSPSVSSFSCGSLAVRGGWVQGWGPPPSEGPGAGAGAGSGRDRSERKDSMPESYWLSSVSSGPFLASDMPRRRPAGAGSEQDPAPGLAGGLSGLQGRGAEQAPGPEWPPSRVAGAGQLGEKHGPVSGRRRGPPQRLLRQRGNPVGRALAPPPGPAPDGRFRAKAPPFGIPLTPPSALAASRGLPGLTHPCVNSPGNSFIQLFIHLLFSPSCFILFINSTHSFFPPPPLLHSFFSIHSFIRFFFLRYAIW